MIDRRIAGRRQVGPLRIYDVPGDDGRRRAYPSVTTILGQTKPASVKAGLARWRRFVGEERADEVLRLSSRRGTLVHGLIEERLGPEEDRRPPCDLCWQDPSYRGIAPLVELVATGTIHLIEGTVWHRKLRYAGALDCLVELPGVGMVLIDWKTSRKRKPRSRVRDYELQLAAYAGALLEMYGVRVDEAWIPIALSHGPAQRFVLRPSTLRKRFAEFARRRLEFERLTTT